MRVCACGEVACVKRRVATCGDVWRVACDEEACGEVMAGSHVVRWREACAEVVCRGGVSAHLAL